MASVVSFSIISRQRYLTPFAVIARFPGAGSTWAHGHHLHPPAAAALEPSGSSTCGCARMASIREKSIGLFVQYQIGGGRGDYLPEAAAGLVALRQVSTTLGRGDAQRRAHALSESP